jgi:hypothetical protein
MTAQPVTVMTCHNYLLTISPPCTQRLCACVSALLHVAEVPVEPEPVGKMAAETG